MTMDLREMNDVKIQLTNRSIMDQYINRYISLMLAQNFRHTLELVYIHRGDFYAISPQFN